jgi:predicted Zn-dependent protease with MMP-like domain
MPAKKPPPAVMARSEFAAMAAPGLPDIERLARDAFTALPSEFRALCGDVVIRIEEFPSDDVISDMKAESSFDILGLFQGIGLAHDQAMPETGRLPNTIFLYRRPILDYWAENDETLGAIVTHVLVHEIGHHFGLSDADMEEIERKAE